MATTNGVHKAAIHKDNAESRQTGNTTAASARKALEASKQAICKLAANEKK